MALTEEFERAFRLHQQGKLREAFLRYDAVLKADPRHAPALHYSGLVLYQAGKPAEAIERIRASLAVDPQSADAWSNLALALQKIDRREAAINAFKEAAKRAPNDPQLWTNLAASEIALARDADAERSSRNAIALDARHAGAWHNLALALTSQQRVLEALDASSRSVALAPDQPAHAGHKAQLEQSIGRFDAARATLETALARAPTQSSLRFELAGLLEAQGRLDAAASAYEDVLRVAPNHGAALSQLLYLRQRLADWRDLDPLRKRFRAGVAANMPLLSPFVLLSQPSSPAEQRRCADTWVAALTQPAQPSMQLLSGARLKLGYLSSDFHTHATAFLAAGLFEQHDRSRFDVVGYSTGPDDRSPMRARLARAFDRFVDAAGWEPRRVADAIRRDRVDVLIDLKGHTEGAPPTVLALRPAPIQVHYLGYPGTLGGRLADYLIGDEIVTPIEEAPSYSESLVLMPSSYQINDRARPIGDAPARSALELPEDAFVFCCFNSSWKINPEVFDVWMNILSTLPASVLWLLAHGTHDPVIANLRNEARRRDIDPARLVFAHRRPNPDYLALYRHADLFLDTWPYNAHTTASDALWSACPIVTWRGSTFAGRVAASLLTAVGLPELIADDIDGYARIAIALADAPAERQRLRDYLEGSGRASPLFDTAATTAALEAAYLKMAEQYRRRMRSAFRVTPA